MDDLVRAIRTTPIIDNHAHPLLIPSALDQYPFIAITSEAEGAALDAVPSSLPHIRAVRQLSSILCCPPTWHDVIAAIELERQKPDDAWIRRCLQGIETILIDDGLDGRDEVYDYAWHSRVTREKCKRIVRIEKVAEEIINRSLMQRGVSANDMFLDVIRQFDKAVEKAVLDPEVVGFKSVICYRTGLNIPSSPLSLDEVKPLFLQILAEHSANADSEFTRLDGTLFNAFLVHRTAAAIQNSTARNKKPFQFHTGLGDKDITLTQSSPSHLQSFIRSYPRVPIVLLHASYPWTKEAGYLASVYQNVYADIGEIFPFIDRQGQEAALREILELCPSEKILWSTDGHHFPERYLLAVLQVRDALEVVLSELVRHGDLAIPQAVKVVQDILFNTSNMLYDLKIPLRNASIASSEISSEISAVNQLFLFLDEKPSIKFLRLNYLDYTATSRTRVIPAKRALDLLQANGSLKLGITKAALEILQNDTIVPGGAATGEHILRPIFSSIRAGPSKTFASVQCEFVDEDGFEVATCPRSILRRVVQRARSCGFEFLLGFEIEVVFMFRRADGGFESATSAHSWNSARALHGKKFQPVLEEVYESLSNAGIHLELFHAESCTGQYEFVLPPGPTLEAVDSLLHAREIIHTIADNHSMRATLFPKPFSKQPGTASHVHISISSPQGEEKRVYESFYAGILRHLRSIIAFTYSNPASYDRMIDGCWAGGRWVTWGTQNRETALRKITGSHWEVKVLDGLANPYLAMASLLAAGTDGIARHADLTWLDCTEDPASLGTEERRALGIEEGLPDNLTDALEALARDDTLRGILGNKAIDRYMSVKRAEMEFFQSMDDTERRQWLIERY